MQFDRYTISLLLLRPDAPSLTDEQEAELQDAHMAHLSDLHDAGHLLGTEQTTGQTLDPAERDALVRLDTAALRARGAHPELVHRLEALAATSARPED